MEKLKKFTSIELLSLVNECKKNHENLKKELLELNDEIKNKTNLINLKLKNLEEIEKNYVLIMKEMVDRNK